MFELEIDKFKKALSLREARWHHVLEKIYDGSIPYTRVMAVNTMSPVGDTGQMAIQWLSKCYVRFDAGYLNLRLNLFSSVFSGSLTYLQKIYSIKEYRQSDLIVCENNLDLLHSSLFKTSAPTYLSKQKVMEKCISYMLKSTSDGLTKFYDRYTFDYQGNGELKNVYLSAIINLNIEPYGTNTEEWIGDFYETCRKIEAEMHRIRLEKSTK